MQKALLHLNLMFINSMHVKVWAFLKPQIAVLLEVLASDFLKLHSESRVE